MTGKSRFAFVVSLLILHSQYSIAAMKFWAAPDNVRVSPISGKPLIQDRKDIHDDYPERDYRTENEVWDGKAAKVRLHAARNEFVAFQVIVETDEPARDIDVSFSELLHPSGNRVSGANVQLFKEWYVHVRRPSLGYEATSLGPGWYADALLPKRKASLFSGFPFSIPDLYNNIPNQKNQAVWIDIYVPFERDTAPPGVYSGEIRIQADGRQSTIAVELNVWDFALPHENHLPGDIWNSSIQQMQPEEEMAYYQMARRHRFLPLVYAYKPGLKIDQEKVEIDWSEYDRRVGPYLDGSAFTEKHGYWGPGYGVPVHHIMLPFNIDSEKHPGGAWPIALPNEGRTEDYETVWKEVGRQFREHFDSRKEWAGVQKIAFLNGLDESYFESAYERMLYYGRLLHGAMGRDWFLYRIDGGYDREAMETLSQEIDLWVCHTVAFDLPTVRRFQDRGVQVWFYGPMIYEQRRNSGCGSNTFLDLDLNINRAIGWIGWKYQTGWVEWEFDWNAFAAWYESENFKQTSRHYNGSGQLIYRGAVMNYDKPIPSIRLKATRRGLQDYEYFWLLGSLTRGRGKSDQLVNQVIYKNPFGQSAMLDVEIWRNDPSEWERVRLEAGNQIERLSR